MAFTISYDIKAIDKFSAIAKKISENAGKMDVSMRKMSKGVALANRSFKKLETTTGVLEKGNSGLADINEKILSQLNRIDDATRGVTRANKAAAKSYKEVERSTRKAKNATKELNRWTMTIGGGMERFGHLLNTRVSLPLIAAATASAKFSMDFETAVVEIQKVTDKFTADKLRGSIRDMTREIPFTHVALAGIAADAARFGIKGTENIETFTRSVAKMAQATDLSVEQAGTAFAKIQIQTGMSATQTENLGSAINTLSNNYATSAGEIVTSMTRTSSAASQFGLSAVQIAGLSAQTNAMSESAQRAGTRMRTLFTELQNPRKVAKFAQAIGMNAKNFEALRKANPEAALMRLVIAVSKSGEAAKRIRKISGGESIQALTAMGKDMMGTVKAMRMSASAFQKNTSLQKEFQDATNTNAAKMKLLWNRVKDLGITLGDRLLPVVERLVNDHLVPLLDKLDKMDDESFETAISIGKLAIGFGLLFTAIGKIMRISSSLSSFLLNINESMASYSKNANSAAAATGKLGKAGGAAGKGANAAAWAGPAISAALAGFTVGTMIVKELIEPRQKESVEAEKRGLKNVRGLGGLSVPELEHRKKLVERDLEKTRTFWGFLTDTLTFSTKTEDAVRNMRANLKMIEGFKVRQMKEDEEKAGGFFGKNLFSATPDKQEISLVVDLRTDEGTEAEVKEVKGIPQKDVNVGKNKRD